MSNAIRVSIVFPCHNRRDLTLLCLKSISRLDSTGLEIKVVAVDDGSTDGSGDAIRDQFPEVEVIRGSGDLWFTEGTNVGVRAALKNDPDYILMINDDQVFDSKCVLNLVEIAERHPRSVVGPLLLLWDAPHRLFQTSPVWDTMNGGWRHWYTQTVWTVPAKPWKVDLIVGNCVLVPAEAFRQHGLMDAKKYPNFGDAEFTPRLRKYGWTLLIDPRARVFCQPNALPKRIRSMGLGQVIKVLFTDDKSVHNLRRRWYSNLDGAPSRWQGMVAFSAFLLRAAFGGKNESERQDWQDPRVTEPPLSKTFSANVVDDVN